MELDIGVVEYGILIDEVRGGRWKKGSGRGEKRGRKIGRKGGREKGGGRRRKGEGNENGEGEEIKGEGRKVGKEKGERHPCTTLFMEKS